ncbi:hypothetical protein [Butyrivibrio sp. FCS006]|uniref:hypothetical protein n=1 Tax=Butyrivibrio sp. FCS006 TaxID=1280684 RepID=UPI000478C66D|nr:hypothetical protein [Butyrivibrio sp. FCS006]
MIGSRKKWGTEGHIEDDERKRAYYKRTEGKKCNYKSESGKCTLEGYVNKGMNCKRPGGCHHFNAD